MIIPVKLIVSVLSGFFGGLSGHQGVHAGLDKSASIGTNAAIAALVDRIRLGVYGINITLLLGQVSISLTYRCLHRGFGRSGGWKSRG